MLVAGCFVLRKAILNSISKELLGREKKKIRNKLNVELKRYAKIEKIPGGLLEESKVINGVMLNKDITHP